MGPAQATVRIAHATSTYPCPVRYIRVIERAMGDGEKRVCPSELPVLRRLRRTAALTA